MLQGLLETTFNVRARVSLGAALLDRCRPGWAPEVNVKLLNIANPFGCPLGQLYGLYRDGLTALGLSCGRQSCRHGFLGSLLGWLIPPLRHPEYSLLRDAWIAAIRERTRHAQMLAMLGFHADEGLCRCRTLATAANGMPSYAMIE